MLALCRLLVASAILLIAGGSLARAVPAHAAPARTILVISRTFELNEQSIDGPTLWTNGSRNFDTNFAVNGSTPAAVLAWTGMDHHVNVMVSINGTQFVDKVTLPYLA